MAAAASGQRVESPWNSTENQSGVLAGVHGALDGGVRLAIQRYSPAIAEGPRGEISRKKRRDELGGLRRLHVAHDQVQLAGGSW